MLISHTGIQRIISQRPCSLSKSGYVLFLDSGIIGCSHTTLVLVVGMTIRICVFRTKVYVQLVGQRIRNNQFTSKQLSFGMAIRTYYLVAQLRTVFGGFLYLVFRPPHSRCIQVYTPLAYLTIIIKVSLMHRSLLGIRLIVEIIYISLVNSILKDRIVLPNSKILGIARTKLIFQTDGMIFVEFIIETQIGIRSIISSIYAPCRFLIYLMLISIDIFIQSQLIIEIRI